MKKIDIIKETALLGVILLSMLLFTGCGVSGFGISAGQSGYGYSNENPQWAPPYYNGARYYYIPDIDSYYDLSSGDFVYLNNGLWYYSQYLPSIYSNFDLNRAFIVVLDNNVFQPWMHNQYYASHYPRYYYRDYYDHSDFPYVRGFNENARSAIYWRENERGRARSWDDENLRNNRHFEYSKEDRQQQQNRYRQGVPRNNEDGVIRRNQQDNRNNQNVNRSNQGENRNNQNVNRSNQGENRNNQNVNRNNQGENRQSSVYRRQPVTTGTPQPVQNAQGVKTQRTNYYGRPIGNPVKVRSEMQNQEQKQKAEQSRNSDQKQKAEQSRNSDQKQKAEQSRNSDQKQKAEQSRTRRR